MQVTKLTLRKVLKLSRITRPGLGRAWIVTRFCTIQPLPLFAIYKPPTLSLSSPALRRSRFVHLSRMLIHSNLFYCFWFPGGRYLCSRFHTYRNDVYRLFQKMAHKRCSRCAHTDPDNPSACPPLFSPHLHPEQPSLVIKKHWDQRKSMCIGFFLLPFGPLLQIPVSYILTYGILEIKKRPLNVMNSRLRPGWSRSAPFSCSPR